MNQIFYRPKAGGFTLLEMLVYVGLLTLLLTALYTSSFSLEDTAAFVRTKATEIQRALDEGRAADEGVHLLPLP